MTRATLRVVSVLAIAIVAAGAAEAVAAARLSGTKGSSAGPRSTSVLGAAWNGDNTPIKGAHVRLRNVLTGHVEATAIANDDGQFTFDNVDGGTYIVELVSDGGRILTVGHPFTIAPGETVATFVRLGTKVPWYESFFSDAAAAATAGAASQGITAIAPVARPVSPGR